MTEQYELIFLKKLQDCINNLDELDEMIKSIGERQSEVDLELSDWLHFLQNSEDLDEEINSNIALKIKELRKKRASLRLESELIRRYKDLSGRMMSDNREFVRTEMQKMMKNLNQPYKNRVITDEDIKFITAKSAKKIITSKKRNIASEELDSKLIELQKQGLSQRKMSEIIGITQASISIRFKKIRERG